MRTPKTNLVSTITLNPESDVTSSAEPKLTSSAALAPGDRRVWQPVRSKLGSAHGSGGRSQAQGHMQHRRLGQRHR